MPNKIKILFVIDHFRDPHAGTEGQLYQLIRHLDRSLFEPHLLLFCESLYIQQHGFPCSYTVLGRQRLASLFTWGSLFHRARLFRRQGFRLAHVYFNDPSLICPPVFALGGIRTLISRRDMGYWYTPLLTTALTVTGRFVAGVVTNSQAVARITAANERIGRDRIHVIPNGLAERPPQENTALPSALVNLREQGAVIVGLVANIRPIKRIIDLVDAVGSLAEDAPKLHAVVIGGGDTTELCARADSLGIADRVHFLGAQPDVASCLKYFDMAVLCSESEGFSNSIIEYMQAGLPVVCTDAGGNPEAVDHGYNGYLYPVGDVAQLASYISMLYDKKERRLEIGAQARASADEKYSIASMVDRHQRLYQRLSRGV